MKRQVDLRWLSLPYSFYKAKAALNEAPQGEDVALMVDLVSSAEIKAQLLREGYTLKKEKAASSGKGVVLVVER